MGRKIVLMSGILMTILSIVTCTIVYTELNNPALKKEKYNVKMDSIIGVWKPSYATINNERVSLDTVVDIEKDSKLVLNSDYTFSNDIISHVNKYDTPKYGSFDLNTNRVVLTYDSTCFESIIYHQNKLIVVYNADTKIILTRRQYNMDLTTITDGLFKGEIVNSKLKKVIKNEEKIKVNKNYYSFNDYIKGDSYLIDTGKSNYKLIGYALINLDKDNIEELILKLNNDEDSVYAILHYEEGIIYGYKFLSKNELSKLKIDGEFIEQKGAYDYNYVNLGFNKEKLNYFVNAKSYTEGETVNYIIKNNMVTQEEFSKYENNFDEKIDVYFKEIH